MTLSLAVDLSTPTGTLAIFEDESLRAEASLGASFKHSERLIDTLDQMLSAQKLQLKDFSRFVCPYGPGSFTGLRIGLATLKAFALVGNARIDVLSSSEVRAIAWTAQNLTKVSSVITHVGTRRMVDARFDEHGALISEKGCEISEWKRPPGVVLSDRETETDYFPSSARHLIPALKHAKTVKTALNAEQYAMLSPIYFGSHCI